QTIAVIVMVSRNSPEPSVGRAPSRLESIRVADIDRAVGAPFPAAVISVEMMAMAIPKKAMPEMTTAKPVVPGASTVSAVSAVSAMSTVTSSESLTRDGQRSTGQRQSSDRSGNDLLHLRHGRLLGWAERGSLCDDPYLEASAAMRCDQDHPIGMGRGVRYLAHARRGYLLNLAGPDSK